MKVLTFLILCFATVTLADDFKTINGKEYKNAKVSRVEPDGIVLSSKSGISKVYFTELPKEVQERFHYDAQKAAEFTSQTIEKNTLSLQQRAEEENKRAEERAKYWNEQTQIKKQQVQIQQQQQAAEQQRQAEIQRTAKPTPSLSREGIPEHTYELLQDYTINIGRLSRRLRRGERYHGRILVDHAEVDINGISYHVPSGILSAPID